jgi:hypothetical protein
LSLSEGVCFAESLSYDPSNRLLLSLIIIELQKNWADGIAGSHAYLGNIVRAKLHKHWQEFLVNHVLLKKFRVLAKVRC